MIEIEVDNRAVLDALNRLLRETENLSPAMRQIGETLMLHTEEAFELEGPGWPELAPSTRKDRDKLGFTGKMLERTGALKRSIFTEYGRDFALIASSMPEGKGYAALHQFGGEAGRGRSVMIPPRPFLPITDTGELSDAAERDILDILNEHLRRALD